MASRALFLKTTRLPFVQNFLTHPTLSIAPSAEIAQRILTQESLCQLAAEARGLDGEVARMLREIGLQIMNRVFQTIQARLLESRRRAGDAPHRRSRLVYSVIFGKLSLPSWYLYGASGGQKPVQEVMGLEHQGAEPNGGKSSGISGERGILCSGIPAF